MGWLFVFVCVFVCLCVCWCCCLLVCVLVVVCLERVFVGLVVGRFGCLLMLYVVGVLVCCSICFVGLIVGLTVLMVRSVFEPCVCCFIYLAACICLCVGWSGLVLVYFLIG